MVSNIILKAATKGIHLYLKDGNLAYKAPEGALTKEFKELIVENKTQIIASLKLQELETSFEYAQLKPVSRNESLPLSFAQQRLWLLDQIDGGSAHYNMPAALKLTGTLNEDALQQAITTILLRHESLRTYFVAGDDGEPIQLIRELDSFEVALTDLSALSQQALQTRIAEAVSTEAGKRFDLTRDLMLRAQLLKISAKEHILLVTMHHIASDGWSQEILVNEFSRLYTAYAQGQDNPLPPLAIQYGDYAHWQRNYLQGAVLNEQLAYWKKQLADLPVLHSLPLDHPRPAVQSFAGNLYVSRIEQATHQRLMAMCQERGATLFMGLHAVFSVLLARYSNEQDIVVGTPVANREQVEVAGLIGFFVNTLVLRSNLSDNPSFHALLEQSKNMLLDAYAHQQVPFEQIVERLQPERSLSHSPLFQVMIALQNNETGHLSLPGLELSEVQKQGPGIAQFDLTLNISEAADGLILAWEYNTDLFEAQTIERMAGHFEVLLSSLLTSPELDVYAHELVTPQEREQLLDTWNDTAAKYRSELCLHELFERQVDTHPKKTALICEETSLSYETLNRRANQLAHYLKAQGVKPDTLVGLSVERSVDMVIAILAILKAGGAYVPLDPSYPQTRLRHMLSDSGVTLVLTQHSVREQLPDCCGQVLCLDDGALQEALTKMATDNLPVSSLGLAPRHLAYVIYTSGSTGQPKGIMVQHQAMLVRQDGWNRVFDLEKRPPVVLQMAGLSVDILLGDMMKALGCGGRLEICPKEVLLSPDKLYQMIQSREITYGDFVPAVIRALTDHLLESGQKLDAMAYISVGCEAWYGRDLRRLKRVIGENTECFNLYGQTESVIDASYCRATELVLADVDTVPVGQPLANTGLYVLNEQQQLQPYGVAGELCVGGKGLALGYAGRAGLTAEKFLAHPFTEEVGQGLYRTGDQAVRRADGSLHFVGRDDEQVKIRGFRVEVKEVEGRLLALEAVKAALVLARQDEGQHKRLVGYLLFEPGQSCSLAALAEHMRAGLPDYMVPSAFVVLESFPLTANGTVDRKALPAPEGDVLGGEYIAPRTETEKTLCRIWQEVLGLERVGISDNFFDLGGHSLLVTKLVARIGEAFEVTLALRKVFEQPRLMDLAALLSGEHSGGMRPPLTAVSREQALPLSFAQQRLWLLDKIDGGSVHYNMPAALRLTGSLNSQALQQAFSTIVGRHESLRTCFVVGDDGEPVQVINTPETFEVPLTDLSVLPETVQQTQIDEAVAKEAAAAFELSRDLMLRARLLKVAEQEHILLVTMHHIASDGWSMGILVNEFSSLYTAYAKGQENPLAPLAIQYGDYAYWQRNWLQGAVLDEQLGYWEKQLAGLPVVHALPLDHARPAVQSFAGAFHITHINKSTYKALTGLCQAQGATLFMGLHAAFSVLLSRYSNEQDIVIGTPVANREQVEVAGLIGFFVNTLVLRSDLSGKPSFQALLEQSKNMLLDGYAHQQVPFEQIVERLQPERSLSHSPLFQVMLALQNNDDGQLSLPDLNLSIVEAREGESAKYDLTLNVVESEDGLGLGWGYNTALFERDTIARMAEHFEVLLSALVQAPEQDVFSHELATAQEREQLLGRWNNTEAEVPLEYCLHELFAEQADRFPKKTALVCDGISLSYGELNRRANQLAHYLKAQGVKAQTLVGLCVERSVDMVVGILGILKAGGAYVPLDPAYPQARLTYMLRDSGVKLVLSQSWLTLPQEQAVETFYLDKEDIFAEQAQDNPEIIGDVGPKSAVYMIYTSGSTGRPKGVVIEQRNLLNFRQVFEHQLEQLDAQKSNWLWHGSFAFDASVKGILALCSGNTLVVASEREALEPSQLLALTAQHDIQVLNLTPALVPVMLDCLEQGDRGHLHLMIGGEALGKALWDRVAAYGARHDRQALNLYGPTETTINASYAVIDGEVMPHIGKPVANTQFYVMDSRQQLVPTGVVGELYIGGTGVARGYLNRDELTAEKFVANPYFDAKDSNSCRRLYRSGDLVRWRADGELEFIGRIDHQVKVRGLRIELGEIEQCLVGDAGVREAAVLAREAGNNDNRLVAYLVPDESLKDEAAFIEAVREQLRKALPDYMVPAAFVVLEALPLTVNGKLDRHALPEPESAVSSAQYVAPRTDTEAMLCSIWQQVLEVDRVGVMDNFFALGGHSLMAISLVTQIKEAFAIEYSGFSIREVFELSSVAELAASIDILLSKQKLQENENLIDSYKEEELEEGVL
ncbi:non-ribosomal peptide synthetase [Pseudoalteromonas maricaloris]|nr:non-ribosomal peptide synthetase [Pseudoalteromonas flavipulchra]